VRGIIRQQTVQHVTEEPIGYSGLRNWTERNGTSNCEPP